jgi:Secretion system C-terminal sorting domain
MDYIITYGYLFFRHSILIVILALPWQIATAQAKLVINGGVITISNGASLVIDNPDNTAITRNNTGYIQSEAAGNQIIWTIGAGNGNSYLLPFGNAAGYFPLQFKATSGTGNNGQLIFSTYPTATWKNSDYLPAGVTNINNSAIDNSAKTIDRFWQIKPQNYSKTPALSNLVFTYADAGFSAPNTITASNLIAQRWNPVVQSWTDYLPPSLVNTGNHTVTVVSVESSQLYNWWALADLKTSLPVTVVKFKAVAVTGKVFTSWQTLNEQNNDHFEVWRSTDGVQFEFTGSVTSAGNSNGINGYSFTDNNPYTGISYYKLKIFDKSGGFTWSAVVFVNMDKTTGVLLYPNPASDHININSSSEIINSKPVASLYDSKGSLLQMLALTSANQLINTSNLAAGIYQVSIRYNSQLITVRFIKK